MDQALLLCCVYRWYEYTTDPKNYYNREDTYYTGATFPRWPNNSRINGPISFPQFTRSAWAIIG